jgi:hypothetical protein
VTQLDGELVQQIFVESHADGGVHVEFRENERGKFLRITEEAHGRRNTIIVPGTGVGEFTAAIGEVVAGIERAPS